MRRNALAALLAAPFLALAVQSPAEALFRGDEFERREFKLEREYFLDILSYLPSFETELRYRGADKAYLVGSGSINSNELFIWQRLKLEAGLDGPWGFSLNYEMDQDFDGVYQHFTVGILAKLGQNWRLEFVGEPLAYKEFADEGLAVQRKTESGLFRVQLLLPDAYFSARNSLGAELVDRPYNLQLTARGEVAPGLELRARADLDFPLEIYYGNPAFDFEFEKYRASVGATWEISDRDTVWIELWGESADKARLGHVPGDVEDFTTEREAFIGRLEYIHVAEDGHRWAFGYEHVRFDEKNVFANDAPETFRFDRVDRIAYFTYSHAFKPDVLFTTGIYADFLDYVEEFPNDPARTKEFDGVESKIGLRLELSGERHGVVIGGSFELDRWAFAGYIANVFVEF